MFDLSKLQDMAKIAGQVSQMQERQERLQKEQLDIMLKISRQLDEVVGLLKKEKEP